MCGAYTLIYILTNGLIRLVIYVPSARASHRIVCVHTYMQTYSAAQHYHSTHSLASHATWRLKWRHQRKRLEIRIVNARTASRKVYIATRDVTVR